MGKVFLKEYSIETEKTNKKIALISDIHYCNNKEKKYLYEVVDELHQLEYDYLCISGDLLDQGEVSDEDWLLEWISALAKVSKVIIGIGNHEQVKNDKEHEYAFNKVFYKKAQNIKNVKVLDNDTFVDGSIRFIGITLPLDYYYEYKESKSYFIKYMNTYYPNAYSDKYNILLCHTPIPLLDENVIKNVHFFENVPLVLCGHMHGGLLPFSLWKVGRGRGIVGPFHRLFPKGSYGVYQRQGSIIVISSGITKISQVHTVSFLNRLFKREITMISLQSKK